MNRKTQTIVRVIAIVLAVLMVGGMVTSVLIPSFAEEAAPERDRYEMNIEYLEDEQALRISQRLVYHNPKSYDLDRAEFYAAANMFRRESALCYEDASLSEVFPYGYAPSGIDGLTVTVDGETAVWGWSGENETVLVVYADIPAGGSCVFEMRYYVLLGENRAFLGADDLDTRLSGFYLIAGIPDDTYHDWQICDPTQLTRWVYTAAADYDVTLILPDNYTAAGTGIRTRDGNTWRFTAENVREFACLFGKRYREYTFETDSGVTVRVLANDRGGASVLRSAAKEAIRVFEERLGAFPLSELTIAESGYAVGAMSFPGLIWVRNADMNSADTLRLAVYTEIARQYIGWAAYAQPVSDAWLSDTLCAYLGLMVTNETKGEAAFLKALNGTVLDAINQTIPGGLYITADARLFTADEYELITLDRGCVVMHELRLAMGDEAFWDGMRLFYEMGAEKDVLGEMDLVDALNSADGGDWEAFLTDWLFNVDEYVTQQVDWYE